LLTFIAQLMHLRSISSYPGYVKKLTTYKFDRNLLVHMKNQEDNVKTYHSHTQRTIDMLVQKKKTSKNEKLNKQLAAAQFEH